MNPKSSVTSVLGAIHLLIGPVSASSADGGKLFAVVLIGGIWVSQTMVAPELKISASKSNVLISWIVPSQNFVLQQDSDMTMVNFTDMATTPLVNFTILHYEVQVPVAIGNHFYRLKR